MPGAFNLKTPRDLLAKLQRDLGRMREAPAHTDHTFNFFVTAEHLLDWLHPGDARKKQRAALRRGEVLLQVVSHIASGAKHFDQLSTHHTTVKGTIRRRAGYFGSGYFASNPFGAPYYGRRLLVVELAGDAKAALGPRIDALSLAEQVFAYWSAPGHVPE